MQQEGVRVIVDDPTYCRKNPERSLIADDTAQDYGFPESEEPLTDNEGNPYDKTLLRCFPKIGVFSLRNKDWGE